LSPWKATEEVFKPFFAIIDNYAIKKITQDWQKVVL